MQPYSVLAITKKKAKCYLTLSHSLHVRYCQKVANTAADSGHRKSKTQNQKSICKVKSQTQKSSRFTN